jgi:hypothetical protein
LAEVQVENYITFTHIVAYADGGGSYTDVNTGKSIYNNLNATPSNVVSSIAP